MEFKFLGLEGDINEGQITQIYVKVGDNVKQGQDLFELEADKLSQAITADSEGVIGAINFKVGDIIKKGEVFASTQGNSSVVTNISQSAEVNVVKDSKQVEASNVAIIDIVANTTKVLATPLARRIARELKIDLNNIKGTGPHGRVLKDDILSFSKDVSSRVAETSLVESTPETKTIEEQTRRVPMTAIRKAIAKAMVKSKTTIPHASLMNEVNVTELVNIRKRIKETIKEESNFKLTYMPFFVIAVVKALKEFPVLNASMDDSTSEIIFHDYFHIGMATDTIDGLIVPVIKHADKKGLFKLAATITDLAVRSKERKFKADEIKGSTFTITNFGSVGLDFGTPVINYPESAILGVGAITKKPIVKDGQIVVADILPLSISIDHRIIDGADAGRFMKRIKELLEAPLQLLT